MDAEQNFISIAALICEPARAGMLWNLLDGKAYTASELSVMADVSPTSASNHLAKLLEAKIIKVEAQGRHRYFSLSTSEVAYVVEALASLATNNSPENERKQIKANGTKYCRTCYDHLAGLVAVQITDALELKRLLIKSGTIYTVSKKGWEWLSGMDIFKGNFNDDRRPLTRQCLDWSERRPHLAGKLGAVLLEKMLEQKWFKRVQFSRELIVTSNGRHQINNLLDVEL